MENIDLKSILARFRLKIGGTLLLLLVENVLLVLYPFLVGLTITGLIDRQFTPLWVLMGAFASHFVVGVTRRLYDTRVYSQIYSIVAAELVGSQRSNGKSNSEISARVELLRELVDFFEHDLPNALMSVSALVGAVVMLGVLDWRISMLCLGAITLLGGMYAIFKQSFAVANRKLNDAYERQMDVVCKAGPVRVRGYFGVLRGRAIRLSNLDAGLSAALEFLLIGMFIGALVLAATSANASPGPIVATMTYVFEFYESLMFFPYLLQQRTRLGDISGRMSGGKQKLT